MSDLKRLTEDAMTRAARRAVGDLLSSDAATKPTPEDAPRSNARRWKIGLVLGLGLLVVLGLLGLALSYWLWFLGAGLLGLGGLYGWWRLRRRFAGRKEKRTAIEPVAPRVERILVAPIAPVAERPRVESDADARALEEDGATRAQAIEEELAAMKARLGR